MLSKRSFEKEKDLPSKKNFVCRKLYQDEFDKRIYGKPREINESYCPLTSLGNSIIGSFIEENKKLENLKFKKEKLHYQLLHSKKKEEKKIIPNWRYSHKPGTNFEKFKADDIYGYNIPKVNNKWLEGPWLAPKQVGTYFDHDIHPLQ